MPAQGWRQRVNFCCNLSQKRPFGDRSNSDLSGSKSFYLYPMKDFWQLLITPWKKLRVRKNRVSVDWKCRELKYSEQLLKA